ncbi:MAG: cyclic nucleotide-binding domain-containing protein [Deltaproteobacteria bacterium]|nr:cyclic nucleotide-binding domain-containing protein [Deltaproteobacteria bacterium]MBN2673355.1 cyclic nucleotide-binding domain-containing protein [Deltaproteobacteria bacterium]
MHWKVRREFLGRLEIFADLGNRDLKAVAKSCSESDFDDGEYLCKQGERGIAAFLIVSGEVEVVNQFDDNDEILLATLGQGAFVGELSIIDGAQRVASVRAKGPVKTLVLTQWAMLGLMKSKPSIAAAMLPVIVKRFRETTQELRHHNHESEHGRKSAFQ